MNEKVHVICDHVILEGVEKECDIVCRLGERVLIVCDEPSSGVRWLLRLCVFFLRAVS